VVFGNGVREGQRRPLERFEAKLPVSLCIEFSQAAYFHGQSSVQSVPGSQLIPIILASLRQTAVPNLHLKVL
jgi:hypothetical protein